jgi:Holliday junction resolvasome RuvABC endonuclease subunit
MKSTNPNPKRVLAIDPTSRGFGFVVLESPTMPVDWGVKAIRSHKEEKILGKVTELIHHYQPEIVVFEDHKGSRHGARIQCLISAICRLAMAAGLKSRRIPPSRVKMVFSTFRASTKHEIAHAVAQQLPELAPRLPPYRKPWMSEDYRMAIFDAAALALTYYYSRQVRKSHGQRPMPESRNPLSASNTA